MKTNILLLLLCVVAFSPVADAFSFGDVVNFFEDVFGPADITGMTIGGTCRADRDCNAEDEVCYSGACVQLCENERSNTECAKLLKKKRVNDPLNYFCSLKVPIGRVARDICLQPTCGNEKLEGREVCDDGNTDADDGCAPRCLRVELGWTCNNERMPSRCSPVCGDGRVVGNERCDDDDTTTETCGDGEVNDGTFCNADCSASLSLTEECDAGGSNSNTGECKADCTDYSGGDGHCYAAREDCGLSGYNRLDCGKCNIYEKGPDISISGVTSTIDAGSSNININITNATSCFYTLYEFKVSGTGRRAKTQLEKLKSDVSLSCDDPSTKINDFINYLPGESIYTIEISAVNNADVITKKFPTKFEITGERTIGIRNLDSRQFYTDIKLPKPEVKVIANPTSCRWTLKDCGEYITLACGSGWVEVDIVASLKSCLEDGVNTFIVEANKSGTIEDSRKEFNYIKTSGQVVRLLKRVSGVRRRASGGGGVPLYPVLIGQTGPGAEKKILNASENATRALLALTLSIKRLGRVPEGVWKKMIDELALSPQVQITLGSLKVANITKSTFAAVPAIQITAFELDSTVDVFESELDSDNEYTVKKHTVPHKVRVNVREDEQDVVIVTLYSNPVEVELRAGECKAVDINEDEYEDLIVCYDEEYGVTINNIIEIDENLESPIDEDEAIISPITYSTVNEYIVTVDREALEKEILEKVPKKEQIEREILKKYSPVLVIITLMLLYVIFVSSFSLENSIRKRHKRK